MFNLCATSLCIFSVIQIGLSGSLINRLDAGQINPNTCVYTNPVGNKQQITLNTCVSSEGISSIMYCAATDPGYIIYETYFESSNCKENPNREYPEFEGMTSYIEPHPCCVAVSTTKPPRTTTSSTWTPPSTTSGRTSSTQTPPLSTTTSTTQTPPPRPCVYNLNKCVINGDMSSITYCPINDPGHIIYETYYGSKNCKENPSRDMNNYPEAVTSYIEEHACCNAQSTTSSTQAPPLSTSTSTTYTQTSSTTTTLPPSSTTTTQAPQRARPCGFALNKCVINGDRSSITYCPITDPGYIIHETYYGSKNCKKNPSYPEGMSSYIEEHECCATSLAT